MNKLYRVKKTEDIKKILDEKKCSSNFYFAVYKRTNSETSHFRYAISVGKKIGKAIIRNRIKRQIRAIVSNLNINIDSNVDVFIVARPKILDIDYQEMSKQLEYLFNKQKLIIKGVKND